MSYQVALLQLVAFCGEAVAACERLRRINVDLC